MTRKQRDVLSVEWVKLELIRTAYATRGGLFAAMDPRMVLGWYLMLAIIPWFTHNLTVLAVLFVMGAVAVALARVGPLILALFVFGLIMESVYIFVAAIFFGGDVSTVVALLELTLKLGTISMASMAAFVSLDPEKLSDALLSLRAPALLAFAVSYGYRMLPILVEEFNTVFDNYRLRSAPPEKPGILGYRTVVHWIKMAVLSFYPIFLNTAQSVRTTVEALETRGFTYATVDQRGRNIRLAYLKVRWLDVVVLALTSLLIAGAFWVGAQWPIYHTDLT
ncbi:MAG TPA: energy-coupling factor transporter transmembrane protein EcfT [Enteractinococcus helveticum]|uniref:Energy-coupling factor transporter transmembrane protein EcfT n=1 Tax=Enteractinococcus helveticum TaxID=1837282 RepID=A0A921FPE1_9MICC|nr:energy-coupling factor transporter transmembrane component T [Enteractinococcus helveticum]HJF15810.1 energy-coupling factor transporter transmembrane protein EcfT [Enteractinococcus helveticum]